MNGYACSDDNFIQKIQDENLACVGLTNYFKFKDEEYALKERLEKLGIKVLMNLELRLDYTNKDDESLDLHILFSETTTKAEIERLLNNIECNVSGNSKKISDLLSEDFKFAVVNFDKLFECLESESLNLQGKYLVGFLSRGKGNARSSSNFEKIANKAHFLIHSTNSQDNIDKDKEFWQQHNKPILQSSDAHSLETIGSKFSWIKAKPSFDGLKQVIYEIERVYIGKESPPSPLYKLEKVQLDFDKNTVWNNEKKDTFCFVDFNKPLYFSPYFTCIIGGRGSGKSTLLNLIANKIDKLNVKNTEKLPTDNKAKITLEPNVIDNIEFLAQNEIEEFATNSVKFTQAIFERLDRQSNKKLTAIQSEITIELKEFDRQITRLLEYDNKTKILENKQKESGKIAYLLQTFIDGNFSKNYTTMNTWIKDKSTRLKWKAYYENTLQNLSQLIQTTELKLQEKDESPETWTNDNEYKEKQKAFNDELKNILQKYQSINFEAENAKITNIEKEISNYREKIDLYLQDRGYNLENLNDLKNQMSRQGILNDEIDKLKKEIEILKQDINSFNMSNIDKKICEFTTQINNEISSINKKFLEIKEKYPENIKEIKVEFTTNSKVFDSVFKEFISKLSLQDKTSSTLKDYLSKINLAETLSYDDVQSFQQKHKDIHNNSTIAYKNLAEIFSIELNFKIYKLLIEKHLRDIESYKILKVLYDDKELQFSSFGQRCTAVIVILLALGNNPIIMDEPEAHLDSSLIANYLVELIKKQKKDRQIIFATHNANFVLNADAELIIKLSNDDNKILAQSFSIEDSENREDLLKLEGGKEAFKKRERKYEI